MDTSEIEERIRNAMLGKFRGTLDPDMLVRASTNVAQHLIKTVNKENKPRTLGVLYATDIGKCIRRTYYDFIDPMTEETLRAENYLKFLLGNIVEESTLFLAEVAGLKVTDQQKVVEQKFKVGDKEWVVRGRIDAIIEDHLIDVKSASTNSYRNYTNNGITLKDIDRGYIYQLGWYNNILNNTYGYQLDTIPKFLFVDKQLGHIKFVPNPWITSNNINARIVKIVEVLTQTKEPVPDVFITKEAEKNGNQELSVVCSYCPYKLKCHPDVRSFKYSNKIVDLKVVKSEPKVEEIKR